MKLNEVKERMKTKATAYLVKDFILKSPPNEVYEPLEVSNALGINDKSTRDILQRLAKSGEISSLRRGNQFVIYGKHDNIKALRTKLGLNKEEGVK